MYLVLKVVLILIRALTISRATSRLRTGKELKANAMQKPLRTNMYVL